MHIKFLQLTNPFVSVCRWIIILESGRRLSSIVTHQNVI